MNLKPLLIPNHKHDNQIVLHVNSKNNLEISNDIIHYDDNNFDLIFVDENEKIIASSNKNHNVLKISMRGLMDFVEYMNKNLKVLPNNIECEFCTTKNLMNIYIQDSITYMNYKYFKETPIEEIIKTHEKIFGNVKTVEESTQQTEKRFSKQDMINFACDVYNKHYKSDKSFKEIANDLINEKPYGEFI